MNLVRNSTTIVNSFNGFTSLLRNERSRFAASPILLISSKPDTAAGTQSNKKVQDACKLVGFVFQQQFNHRTVVAHPNSGYTCPTLTDVNNAIELAARVGATTVAAVGSGCAIDLAKAIVQNASSVDFDELILIPATYGGIFASGSSHSLLFDPKEESIVVHPNKDSDDGRVTTTFVNIEASRIDPIGAKIAVLAAIAVNLDRSMQRIKSKTVEDIFLSEALLHVKEIKNLSIVSKAEEQSFHENLTSFLLKSGMQMSYGLGDEERSIPLALATSLIPKVFPQHTVLGVMASLMTAIYNNLNMEDFSGAEAIVNSLFLECKDLLPILVTTESMEVMMSEIHTNQSLWNCLDAPDSVLRTFLKETMLT